MIPYYITFLVSCIFCYMGELSLIKYSNTRKEKQVNQMDKKFFIHGRKVYINPRVNKFALRPYHVYFFFSVLFVALLAGMRDYSVGTDILAYGNPLFHYARNSSLWDMITNLGHIEPLYLVLVKFSSLFSKEPHILYFFTGLLIYSCVLGGIVKFQNKVPSTIAWFAFLCLLYGDTFNVMRQSIAIAICIWAFSFFVEKKYFKSLICISIAYFFHNSAIIGILICLLYFILQKSNKLWVKVVLVLSMTGGLVFFNEILSFLMNTGFLNSKMSRYYIEESTEFSIFAILIRIPFLALIVIQKKLFFKGGHNKKFISLKNEAEADFYIVLLFVEMFTVELSAFVSSLYRISLYFIPFRGMAYARYVGVQTNRKSRILYEVLLIIYLLIIFIYQNQIKGNNEIYPYIFG